MLATTSITLNEKQLREVLIKALKLPVTTILEVKFTTLTTERDEEYTKFSGVLLTSEIELNA